MEKAETKTRLIATQGKSTSMPVTTDYFKKLCELCKAFGTARNRRELLEMIFASAMEILEGKAACLYLLEPGKPGLIPVSQKGLSESYFRSKKSMPVSYTHLRAHETRHDLVCRLLLEQKKK